MTRVLELTGETPSGRPCRGCLVFSPAVDPTRTAPVGYVTEAVEGGLSIVGWLPATAYGGYWRVLEAGGALHLHFELRDRTSGYLRRLAIGRSDEAQVATIRGRPVQQGLLSRRPSEIAYAMPL